MSWPGKLIEKSFIALFILVPLIFLPTTSELFEFPKIIVTYLITATIVFAWASRCIIAKKVIFKRTPLDLPILLFLTSQFLSLLFSLDPRTSWLGYYSRFNGGFLSLLSYSLLYWAFVSNMNRRSTLSTINYSLITAGVVALWGVAEHFGIDDSWWVQDVRNRVFSTLGQPNWLAAYLVALIFIPLSKALTSKKIDPIHYSLFTIYFLALLFTKSRSGLLAFGFSSLVFWCFLFINHKSKIINQFLVFSLLTLTLTLTIANPLRDLVFTPQTPPVISGPALEIGGTESGAIRKIVWTGALRIWRSSPKAFWLGTGPETFAMAYYQFRPIEHNYTSEWELLYNKAHNEFLNYLATTGLLGLIAYLILLITIALAFFYNSPLRPPLTLRGGSERVLQIALFAGWLTIPITNFWGFSVVIVQILLFLLPAFAQTLSVDTDPPPPSKSPLASTQIISILISVFAFSYLLFTITKYFIADVKYASGQKNLKAFTATEDPQYILASFSDLKSAFALNPRDPPIAVDLSNVAAYMSIIVRDSDATTSSQLAQIAVSASGRAIQTSPRHPNYYKARSRTYIILSTYDDSYLSSADENLASASAISPTDPRIPYNRGVIALYRNDPASAQVFFRSALDLKPDFADPRAQLDQIATLSAQPILR